MNKYIILIAFVMLFKLGNAQDRIITVTNDTIDCKISKLSNDNIHFTYVKDGEIRKTLIAKKDVKSFNKDLAQADGLLMNSLKAEKPYSSFRLALQGGWANRLGKVESGQMENYFKELKKGYSIGAEATYFISESVGFGVKFSNFKSSASLDNYTMDFDEDGISETGTIKDNTSILFIGPGYTNRFVSQNGNALISSIFIGYLSYLDDTDIFGYTGLDLKGSTLGMSFDLGYDIRLSEKLYLGFQASVLRGTLTSITQEAESYTHKYDLDEDEYESLSRIDLSVGLRIYL